MARGVTIPPPLRGTSLYTREAWTAGFLRSGEGFPSFSCFHLPHWDTGAKISTNPDYIQTKGGIDHDRPGTL